MSAMNRQAPEGTYISGFKQIPAFKGKDVVGKQWQTAPVFSMLPEAEEKESTPAPAPAEPAPEPEPEKERTPIEHSPEVQQAKERVANYENDVMSGKTSDDIFMNANNPIDGSQGSDFTTEAPDADAQNFADKYKLNLIQQAVPGS
jgi:hypothetical protein